jgi:DNA-binding NtrC family response regulator
MRTTKAGLHLEKHEFSILVVDDDEFAREVITSLLLKEGYSVASAQDGVEAIGILKVENMDLVITDLRMPEADGIEVLKHAVRNNTDCTVVILTAYGTLDTTLEAIKEGAYDYLTKPFKMQEIALLAEKAYKRTQLIKDNRELKMHLRDAYRDMDLLATAAENTDEQLAANWQLRIERLKAMNVLTGREADLLKQRLDAGDLHGKNFTR